MERHICLLLAAGILWPQQSRSLEIEPIFWPEFVFAGAKGGPNPNSVALFQLTGLAVDRAVTVTMHSDDLPEVLLDGDTLETDTASMTFFPSAPEGVVRLVKLLPPGTQPGKHVESLRVRQGESAAEARKEIAVKAVDDKDVAIVQITPGKAPAQKPLAYGRTGCLAEGSEISSGASDPDSYELTLYTLADVPLNLKWSKGRFLYEFTPFAQGDFIAEYFGVIFAGTLPPGRSVLSVAEEAGTLTAVLEEDASLPQSFALAPNYPNPFNGSTAIQFALPAEGEVELSIYDLTGQKVAALVAGRRGAGTYTVRWDGRDAEGDALASGVYLYRLRAGGQRETRKLLLLR